MLRFRILSQTISPLIPIKSVSRRNYKTNYSKLTLFHLALSGDAQTVKLSKYLPTLPETHSIAVFVGAMARGSVQYMLMYLTTAHFSCRKDDFADAFVDEKISISDYSLSASVRLLYMAF